MMVMEKDCQVGGLGKGKEAAEVEKYLRRSGICRRGLVSYLVCQWSVVGMDEEFV